MIYFTTMSSRLSTLAFVVLLAAATTAAAQDGGGWLAGQGNGCKLWLPAIGPDFSLKWTGPCKDGLTDGNGTALLFFNGKQILRYDGDMRAGRFDGRGFAYFPFGTYTGGWRDGKRSGQGIQTWKDGSRYDGNWKDDKASGSGTLVDNKGTSYAGTWLSGCLRRTPGQLRPPISVGANDCPRSY